MDKMRDFMQSWPGKVVLVLVMAPMALLGVNQFGGGSQIGNNEVVKVGDSAIGINTYRNEINAYRERLSDVDSTLINNKALADEVLESMIQRALLENQVKFLGMTMSDETITRLLRQDPMFQQNGQFSNELFASYLQNRNMTKDMLFDNFRVQLSLRQLTANILGTAVYPENQISRLLDLQNQSRKLWIERFEWQQFADEVHVTPEQIKEYYQANSSTLTKPESVELLYLQISPNTLKVEPPTENDLQAQYQTYLHQNGFSNSQELAQILVTGETAKAQAEDIKARLDAGESFEALAKSHSQDPSGQTGGNIGMYNPAVFGEDAKAVETALLGLSAGQISQPVKTKFGYQIFKVVKVADVPSLDSVRDELSKQATEYKRQSEYADMVAKINNLTIDGMGLADVAAELKLQTHIIKEYTKTDNRSALAYPMVIDLAFDESLLDGQVSTNISVAGTDVWVQPSNYQPAKPLTLQEATPSIKQTLIQQQAIALAFKKATSQVQKVKGAPEEMVKHATELGVVTLQSPQLTAEERASLFTHHAKGLSAWAVQTATGASILVGSPIVSMPEMQLSPQKRLEAVRLIRDNLGQDQFEDYLAYLQDTKEVVINHQALSNH